VKISKKNLQNQNLQTSIGVGPPPLVEEHVEDHHPEEHVEDHHPEEHEEHLKITILEKYLKKQKLNHTTTNISRPG